jgi:hypothetical protein
LSSDHLVAQPTHRNRYVPERQRSDGILCGDGQDDEKQEVRFLASFFLSPELTIPALFFALSPAPLWFAFLALLRRRNSARCPPSTARRSGKGQRCVSSSATPRSPPPLEERRTIEQGGVQRDTADGKQHQSTGSAEESRGRRSAASSCSSTGTRGTEPAPMLNESTEGHPRLSNPSFSASATFSASSFLRRLFHHHHRTETSFLRPLVT